MSFSAGKTILLVMLFGLIGAAGILSGLALRQRPDQIVWAFDPSHAATYRESSGNQPPLIEIHKDRTGRSVQVQVMPSRALDARLLSLILSNASGNDIPDVVEIEIGSVGKYFRTTPEKCGLLPLNDFIAKDEFASSIPATRMAMWSHGGQIFGIARDLHPVTITYRRDLFEQAGIDLSEAQTWSEFAQACLRYQQYWRSRGQQRWAMQLSRWSASDLMIMLHQQRIELVEENGKANLRDPRIASTIAFYAQLVSGAESISTSVSSSASTRDLADGNSAALLTPDWRVEYLRWDPDLLGQLAMIPLPRFSPQDAPTASWGGTMVSIPRAISDPQASWKLLQDLQLTPEALYARQYHSNILPAATAGWSDEFLSRADPQYRGQQIIKLYAELARQLPTQRVSPYSTVISQTIAGVLSAAQNRLETHGPADLEAFCREQLLQAQEHLDRLLEFAEDRP